MRNWNVHDLLPHKQIILFREKTLRTFRSANDLLLEQKGKRHEFRHSHQLFRRLRAKGNPEDEILGTSITCSGICKSRCRHASTNLSPPCGPRMSRTCTTARRRRAAPRCAISTLRRSCRRNHLSRRSRSQRAALALSTSIETSSAEAVCKGDTEKKALLRANGSSCCGCCGCRGHVLDPDVDKASRFNWHASSR